MPKYLIKSSLSTKGVEGTMADGGTARKEAVAAALASVGGSLEAMYYAFGDVDVYAIVEMPSHAHMISAAATVAASGTGSVETVVLVDPSEVDQAASLPTDYRPPGG